MKKSPLKIAFFGMPGSGFSSVLLQHLVAQARSDPGCLRLAWLVIPARPETLPDPRFPVMIPGEELLEIAREAEAVVVGFAEPDSSVLNEYWAAEPPDLLICACFPFKIPAEIVQLAALGGWNLHPSLLPAYRGPEPIFWQLRDGVAESGITVHQLSDVLDAGDILAQRRHTVPAGIAAAELSRQLAQLGGTLLEELLSKLASGRLSAIPQVPEGASYQHYPQASDFMLNDSWSAERAWRFIKGTSGYGENFILQTRHGNVVLKDVSGYLREKTANESFITSDQLHIQMASGTLIISSGEIVNKEGLTLT